MSQSGMATGVSGLSRLADAQSRTISPENPAGVKGGAARAADGVAAAAARDLGQGWKVNPYVYIRAGETLELADIDGPGVIRQIWLTPAGCPWRLLVFRFYWDDQEKPSVECPLGDFFAAGWGGFSWSGHAQVSSLPVCVNPGSALSCYWEMPFRRRARITIENLSADDARLYYQVNFELCEVGADAAYLHAQFRRSNPLSYKAEHPILERVSGRGHYVGTYLAWGSNSNGWWGEGEVKFFLDGDEDWPTIASTGTEDYFLGSYNFWVNGSYQAFTTPYSGLPQVIIPDGRDPNLTQSRFGMYRWHLTDPVRFGSDIRVSMQALGWRSGGRYLPLQDDISSVAFWYQTLPTGPFPALPDADGLEII